jgi:hypothetical protein
MEQSSLYCLTLADLLALSISSPGFTFAPLSIFISAVIRPMFSRLELKL